MTTEERVQKWGHQARVEVGLGGVTAFDAYGVEVPLGITVYRTNKDGKASRSRGARMGLPAGFGGWTIHARLIHLLEEVLEVEHPDVDGHWYHQRLEEIKEDLRGADS